MASITCTNCGAVLKTKDPVPPGKKVKCPKCEKPFVVQAEEEEAGVAAGEPPDENPFATDGPAKKGKGKADDEGDEGEGGGGDDDAPKKGKGKDGDKKKSNTTLIAIIVGVVLLCCCCPSCGGAIFNFFGEAIKGAMGIGAAVQQKKADDELKKAMQDMFKDLGKEMKDLGKDAGKKK